jgi:hypothetical protein
MMNESNWNIETLLVRQRVTRHPRARGALCGLCGLRLASPRRFPASQNPVSINAGITITSIKGVQVGCVWSNHHSSSFQHSQKNAAQRGSSLATHHGGKQAEKNLYVHKRNNKKNSLFSA